MCFALSLKYFDCIQRLSEEEGNKNRVSFFKCTVIPSLLIVKSDFLASSDQAGLLVETFEYIILIEQHSLSLGKYHLTSSI